MKRMTALATAFAGALAAGAAVAQEGPIGPMGPMGPMGGMMMGPPDGTPGTRGLDFAAIDTDGNGSLSRAELQARAAARIGAADANGDGAIDREELIAVLPGSGRGIFHVFSADPAAGMADRILAMLGATEAGQVPVTALADHRVNLLLTFADTDRDAAISQAEGDRMAARGWHRGGRGERWMERYDDSERRDGRD
jgi:hypothetical protein